MRHFVYLSSTTVYGAGPERNRPAVEGDPVSPVRGFQYSEHKAAAERLVLEHSERNPKMRACILRGCVTMAAGAENFITQAFARRVLPIPAGARSRRCNSCTLTTTRQSSRRPYPNGQTAYSTLRETARSVGGTWSERPGPLSMPLPAPILKGLTGLTWRLRLQDYSKASGLNFIQYPWLASTEKARSELGWQPKHTSQDAVEDWARLRRG